MDIAGLTNCIDELTSCTDGHMDNGKRVIVFIDGMAGAGKTTLAGRLVEQYKCNLINMDSFFLRPEQKTPGRLVEIGGNIDYERFIDEVIAPLLRVEAVFDYRPYDCSRRELAEPVTVLPKKLTIIEGVYSLHPKIISKIEAADVAKGQAESNRDKDNDRGSNTVFIRVFMKISRSEQRTRLMARDPELYAQFESQWLPMENNYFKHFAIQDKCDFVLGETE